MHSNNYIKPTFIVVAVGLHKYGFNKQTFLLKFLIPHFIFFILRLKLLLSLNIPYISQAFLIQIIAQYVLQKKIPLR